MRIQRRLVLGGAIATVSEWLSAAQNSGRNDTVARPNPGLCFVREFPNAQVEAISPNGEWLCLHYGTTVRQFRGGVGQVFGRGGKPSFKICLVRCSTWREIWAKTIPDQISGASFFAEGDRLFAEARVYASQTIVRTICDINTLMHSEEIVTMDRVRSIWTYAYAGDTVVQHEYQRPNSKEKFSKLNRVRMGTSEVLHSSGSQNDSSVGVAAEMSLPAISADRETVLHLYGNELVCRNSTDLSVRWSRRLDAAFNPIRFGIAPKGTFAVVAMWEQGKISHRARKVFIEVLSGKDGKQVGRLEVDGTDSVAVSDDGRLVAAGTQLRQSPRIGRIQTVVRLCDVQTGAELQKVIHDELSVDEHLASGLGHHGLLFSPDGKYLFSSGKSTRVWALTDCRI